MRRRSILQFAICISQFAMLLAVPACQPANRYGPPPKVASVESSGHDRGKADDRQPLSVDVRWQETPLVSPRPDTPIEFVHEETNRDEWRRLSSFWNAGTFNDPKAAAAVIGLAPLATGALASMQGPQPIKIKVPLGLDDPRAYVPASNPPTLKKWELGRRLFFDKSYLTAKSDLSCAGCHDPARVYTDHKKGHQGVN